MKSAAGSADWRLEYVRLADVDTLWPAIEPFLRRAFDKARSELTPEFIYERAKEDRLRLWMIHRGRGVEAAFVAGEWPDKTVEIFALAGRSLLQWLPTVVREFSRSARAAGFKTWRIIGRRGWRRCLAPHGFTFRGFDYDRVVMEMALDA